MTIDDITKQYGGSFTPNDITKKYGGTFTPETPVASPKQPGLLSKIGSSIGNAFKSGVSQAKEGYEQARSATNPIQLLEGGTKLAAGAINTAFSPLAPATAPISNVTEGLANKISDNPNVQKFAMSSAGKNTARVAEDIGNLATIGQTVAGVEGAPKVATVAKEAFVSDLEKIRTQFAERSQAKAIEKATKKIQDMITPNPTAKEAQLAQRQGRFIEGKDATLFKSGTPDKLAPSQKVQSATQTIIKNIPNAAKMKPSELYTAVESKIGQTAKSLRPQMEATPIKPETIQKINTEWETLKKSQMEAAPATEEPNVLKRQKKFESFLQKSEANHQGDLWDTRIKYDSSIPDAVKKATSNSSESLQLQKEEWLQNRAVLNNAINDTKLGMGQASQKAFSDMTDMYEAKTNLQSKAKVDTTVAPSKIYQALTGKTAKTLGAIAGVGTGVYGIKKVAEAATK